MEVRERFEAEERDWVAQCNFASLADAERQFKVAAPRGVAFRPWLEAEAEFVRQLQPGMLRDLPVRLGLDALHRLDHAGRLDLGLMYAEWAHRKPSAKRRWHALASEWASDADAQIRDDAPRVMPAESLRALDAIRCLRSVLVIMATPPSERVQVTRSSEAAREQLTRTLRTARREGEVVPARDAGRWLGQRTADHVIGTLLDDEQAMAAIVNASRLSRARAAAIITTQRPVLAARISRSAEAR